MTPANRGFTLVELIVSVGLFAVIMLLASGAYLMMISINRQSQSTTTGTNDLAFAIETMARSIRIGTQYSCGAGGDCTNGGPSFSFKNSAGTTVSYSLANASIQQTIGAATVALSDPSVTVSSLTFYVSGTQKASQGDYDQPHVTIIITGSVSTGPGQTQPFSIETGATMRGSDL